MILLMVSCVYCLTVKDNWTLEIESAQDLSNVLSVHGAEISVPYLLGDNYIDSLVSFLAEILSCVVSAFCR